MLKIRDNSYRDTFYRKAMLALLFLGLFVPCHSAWGRNITLVYDDSTSMTGDGKWGYANYAAQSLAALLNDNDTLAVVKMSRPGLQQIETFSLNSQKSRQKTIKEIQKTWREGGNTPYQAVNSAVEYSISNVKEKNQQSKEVTQENDWLVIMTDGGFAENEVDSSGQKDIERLLKEAGGKVRVIFFLIGSGSDRRLTKLWLNTMPIDLVESEEKPGQIIASMERISALVTGRDVEPISFEKNVSDPKDVSFESPFPLRRLIVFEQKPGGQRVSLQKLLIGNKLSEAVFHEADVETPNGPYIEKVLGRVTQGKSDAILSPGKYTLSFDHEVKKKDVQILAESAVDFSVSLYSDTGKKLQPSPGNEYEVCIGDPLKVVINFFTQGNFPPIMLDGLSSKLSVKAMVANSNIHFNLAPAKDAMEGTITAVDGQQILSAEARYPGYFYLKSNILSILGKDCSDSKVSGEMQSPTGETLSLSYVWADQMEEGVKASLVVTSDDDSSDGHYKITASGLPKGVELRLLGKTLSQQQPSVDIDIRHGVPVEIAFLRNRDFREDKKFTVKLTGATDRKIKWLTHEAAYTIQPVPRNISGHLSGLPWSVPVNELESLKPAILNVTADKKQVAADELIAWEVYGQVDGFNLEISRDAKLQGFEITPKAKWGFVCFTKTGVMPVKLTVKGPFPGEETEITANVTIQDINWWEKWQGFIFSIITILLLVWYLIGLWRKDRFSRMAQIHYEEKMALRKQSTGKFTDLLAGNWFSRYMIPYVPEKKLVRDIVFQAGSSDGQIIIPKKQQRQGMIINNNEIMKPERNVALLANQCLIERHGKREKIYTYING